MVWAYQHSPAAYYDMRRERELRVWRTVGVEKLFSGGVRLKEEDREEPEA